MIRSDPIFGVESLRELDRKCKAKIKPNPKFKEQRKLRYYSTRLCKERMRYVYLGE